MSFKTVRRQIIEEVPWGMYVWRTAEGELVGDDDGNTMNVFCTKGDQKAIKAITDAAAYYGYPEGQAEWWSGARPITDEEFEEQQARERMGLVADPMDYGAIQDEAKQLRREANGR